MSLASAEWKRKYEAMHTSFELQRSMHGQMEAAWRTQINQSAAQWEAGEKDYKAQKVLMAIRLYYHYTELYYAPPSFLLFAVCRNYL